MDKFFYVARETRKAKSIIYYPRSKVVSDIAFCIDLCAGEIEKRKSASKL